MIDRDDALRTNHANWESRVDPHASSETYDLARFAADAEHLSHVVRFDLPRLGPIEGFDVVHLQCHIGTDTVSLARLGARVTGLDFSGRALEVARGLAVDAGVDVRFVESTVSGAVDVLGHEAFDLVYTGVGALCWLPDIDEWAAVVSALLRPGGRLFLREGHPVMWALDDPRPDELLVLRYPYFETDGVRFHEEQTYVDHDEPLAAPDIVHFNHGLGEIFTALLDRGIVIDAFTEHDSAPWSGLGDQMTCGDDGEFRLRHGRDRLPCTYTLRATKR